MAHLTKSITLDHVTSHLLNDWPVCVCIAPADGNQTEPQRIEEMHNSSIPAGSWLEGCYHFLVVTPTSDLAGMSSKTPCPHKQLLGQQWTGYLLYHSRRPPGTSCSHARLCNPMIQRRQKPIAQLLSPGVGTRRTCHSTALQLPSPRNIWLTFPVQQNDTIAIMSWACDMEKV